MTTKIKILLYGMALFAVAIVVLATPQLVSARTTVRMKQVIRRIPCGVDHLTDTNGVDHYFAPRSCGRLITPSIPASENAPLTSLPGGSSTNQPLYLETYTGSNNNAGYLLMTQKGMKYSFRLYGDNPVTAPRYFEISEVGDDEVIVRFIPGDKVIVIEKGKSVKANLAYDTDPDIGLSLESVSADGTAVLRVWFPVEERIVGRVDDNNHVLMASSIVLSLTIFTTYTHLHGRYRSRAERAVKGHWRIA